MKEKQSSDRNRLRRKGRGGRKKIIRVVRKKVSNKKSK